MQRAASHKFSLSDHDQYHLVMASMLMAFVEMMLMRWVGANILYLFYFTNFILIASFLGIGIGFLRAGAIRRYFKFSPILLSLLVLFCYMGSYEYQVNLNPDTGNLSYESWLFKNNVYPLFLSLPIMFIAVTMTMASIADAVAVSFKKFPSLIAYRLEVLGTLGGIIIFALLSYLQTPPLVWGAVATAAYVALYRDDWRKGWSVMMLLQISGLLLMLGVFYHETMRPNHAWSKYYKIEVKAFGGQSHVVNVNGLAQQIIESVDQRKKTKPFYWKPYERMVGEHALDNVLVIGAGTGGDTAIVLAQGAKHVDAVEIDEKLYGLGKKLNPNKPYDDQRVSAHINDGRAFLENTQQRYDLIIYALTDSLMAIPGQSSVRLESFLYTQEGLAAAARHLKPNGVFTIYNYYGQPWFVDRLANTLSLIYKHPPCVDTYGPRDVWATVLTISPDQGALQCMFRWWSKNEISEQPSTDNHPFIYLQENNLPIIYQIGIGLIGLLTLLLMTQSGVSVAVVRSNFDLFLMGAAFLLLESKSVVTYALLFGATWMVNSLVFIGILLSVYAAIELTQRVEKFNVAILYALLVISILVVWLVPMSLLLSLPYWLRFIAATTITFTPVFLANLIFSHRMNDISASTDAMGANLIGAVVGGLLEYSALAFGYQHFALIILALYLTASLWLLYSRTRATALLQGAT